MNETNSTTFCVIAEEKRKLRKREPQIQKKLNILISIKNDLVKCYNNVVTITQDEMKAIRKKLYMIMKDGTVLTIKEREILQECKNTIKMIRISHPEIFEVGKKPASQSTQMIKNLSKQKPSIDSVVDIDIVMDSLDTYTASTSSNQTERETKQILEVFRQAKEIIDYHSNQNVLNK